MIIGLLTNAGVQWTPAAVAAGTDSIVTTATVGSSLEVADQCGGAFTVTVTVSAFAGNGCAVDFGSSNDATTNLQVGSTAGAFLAGGVFGDHGGSCTALSGDTTGLKVSAVGAGVTAATGCTVSAAGTNADFVGVPDTLTSICSSTIIGTTNSCTLAVGIIETGGDAPAGNYAGTLNLDVIG